MFRPFRTCFGALFALALAAFSFTGPSFALAPPTDPGFSIAEYGDYGILIFAEPAALADVQPDILAPPSVSVETGLSGALDVVTTIAAYGLSHSIDNSPAAPFHQRE